MSIYEYDEEAEKKIIREEEHEQGRLEGRREGRLEGEKMLAALINSLLSAGKNEDIPKVTTDAAFREKLYIQYGLKKA